MILMAKVFVDRLAITRNQEYNKGIPVFIIEWSDTVRQWVDEVQFTGPTKLVYKPDQPIVFHQGEDGERQYTVWMEVDCKDVQGYYCKRGT